MLRGQDTAEDARDRPLARELEDHQPTGPEVPSQRAERGRHVADVLQDLPADDQVEATFERRHERLHVRDVRLVIRALGCRRQLARRDVQADVAGSLRPHLRCDRGPSPGADIQDVGARPQCVEVRRPEQRVPGR
jgi:hypothetical protein